MDYVEVEISRDESYSVTFEERWYWTDYFHGKRQRRSMNTKTTTIVTEYRGYENIDTSVRIPGEPPSVTVEPSEYLSYTIINESWRHEGSYYTVVRTETQVETTPGAWVDITVT